MADGERPEGEIVTFVSEDRVLKVRHTDGRFRRVLTPEGIQPGIFRKTVASAYTAYRLLGAAPNLEQIRKYYAGPKQTMAKILTTDEFAKALEYRGVPWNSDDGLTLEQQTAMIALSDPTDRRSTRARLKDLGISQAKYSAWLKDPLFMEVYAQHAEDNFAAAVPMALNRMISNADNGDSRSIEKVLEITGRYNPAQQQMQDARVVVLSVIDAVNRHVLDAGVREAILTDIHSATLGFDANNQKALGG